MTRKEFVSTAFGRGDQVIYKGITFDLASADFEDYTVGFIIQGAIHFVPCEQVEYIPGYIGSHKSDTQITYHGR